MCLLFGSDHEDTLFFGNSVFCAEMDTESSRVLTRLGLMFPPSLPRTVPPPSVWEGCCIVFEDSCLSLLTPDGRQDIRGDFPLFSRLSILDDADLFLSSFSVLSSPHSLEDEEADFLSCVLRTLPSPSFSSDIDSLLSRIDSKEESCKRRLSLAEEAISQKIEEMDRIDTSLDAIVDSDLSSCYQHSKQLCYRIDVQHRLIALDVYERAIRTASIEKRRALLSSLKKENDATARRISYLKSIKKR